MFSDDEINEVRRKILARIRRKIAKFGPLKWSEARAAGWGECGGPDAYFHNQTILAWVNSGELKTTELEDGDSKITV